MLHTDICIAGAGIIGLSVALELRARNLSVIVVEAADPLREASIAAAGMLAAKDPHNPAELFALSQLSISLYSEYLERIHALSGTSVPFQTFRTLQQLPSRADTLVEALNFNSLDDLESSSHPIFYRLEENSIDPRQLAPALLAATQPASIRILTQSPVTSSVASSNSVHITTSTESIDASHFVDCTGAWSSDPAFRVLPIKGQMLAVALPGSFPLRTTIRARDFYIVPRTLGPNAGRAIIGATVEDIGFDKQVHSSQIAALHHQAAQLVPQLAHARVIESWAGLRPATPDRLPLLGPHPTRKHHWVATGHYRNGILLAPATARVIAQSILGEAPTVPLDIFSAARPSSVAFAEH